MSAAIDSAAPGARAGAREPLAWILMVASGFAGLGYQVAWTRQAALWLGHESAAVLAVVAAFFGGIALGAFALSRVIGRSARPGRWYAACELVIGAWAVLLAFTMEPAAHAMRIAIGIEPSVARHWATAFAGTFLLLLPATAAMGATLPAMERALRGGAVRGEVIPGLYAANTLGAFIGVVATAFWLVPRFGLTATILACAALNFSCAATAGAVLGRRVAIPVAARGNGSRRILGTLAATGLLGIAYEVLVVRVLSQVTENTVYTFAMLLAVYLAGTAAGAAMWRRGSARGDTDLLVTCLAAACVAGVIGLAFAEPVQQWLEGALGGGMGAALGSEASLAIAAFFAATFVMGALFSHLCVVAREEGIGFGRAIAVNTAGAALAPIACVVLLAAGMETKGALLLVAAGYLGLSSPRAWLRPATAAAALAIAIVAIWPPSLATVDVPAGGRLVSRVEGALATVSVVEDAQGVARLHINNRQQEGSSATRFADARQGLLPILLHASPRRALFLGLGTGVTSYSAAEDPALRVDTVELLPEVIAASARFTGVFDPDARHPGPRLVAGDARRFVRISGERYDVIVSDNFHPARDGSASLYTVEHFRAVRERLASGGVFCQWLPLHQLDLETLRSIVRSYLAAFPRGYAMLATNSLDTPVIGLVSRADDAPFDLAAVRSRLASIELRDEPAAFGLGDELAVLGSFVAGPTSLAAFAGDAPVNTDDRPVVAYLAPRITYDPDSTPRDRLVSLLRNARIEPAELVAGGDAAWNARLAAYWKARDRFIEAGRDVKPTADVRRMLAQVGQPLLEILRISPDFRPAYDPLLRMGMALATYDAASARGLLLELRRLQPARPEATEALARLDAAR